MEYKYYSDYFMLLYKCIDKVLCKESAQVNPVIAVFGLNYLKNYLDAVFNREKNFKGSWGLYDGTYQLSHNDRG